MPDANNKGVAIGILSLLSDVTHTEITIHIILWKGISYPKPCCIGYVVSKFRILMLSKEVGIRCREIDPSCYGERRGN